MSFTWGLYRSEVPIDVQDKYNRSIWLEKIWALLSDYVVTAGFWKDWILEVRFFTMSCYKYIKGENGYQDLTI